MARKQQTLADYVVTALSPLLIMLLVGSLTFFLLEIIYVGDRKERVQWVLFWFVFATVLIARIGIEQGRAHAAVYAAGMAVACGLFAAKFLPQYLTGVAVLLLVIWWCADKLTWDCTFIDDGEDASGAGLLQQAGIDAPPTDETAAGPVETEKQRMRRLRREEKLRAEQPPDERPPAVPEQKPDPVRPRRKPRTHAPGVWVVYFSLLALPLFGLGQTRLPMDQPDARTFAFRMLWVYVAAALGLLLTTSFLGLRRYLRQRNIQMPAKITAGWLTTGLILALIVMLLCLVVPLPQSETSLTAMLDRFADEHRASDRAFVGNDGGEGEGEGKGDGEGEGEGAAAPRDHANEAPAGDQQAANGRPQPGENGNEPSPEGKPSRQQGASNSDDNANTSRPPGESANQPPQTAEADKPSTQETTQASNSPQAQNREETNSSERPPGRDGQQQRDENPPSSRQTAQNRDPQDPPEDRDRNGPNAGNDRPDEQPQRPRGNPPQDEGEREEQQPDEAVQNEPEPPPPETSASSSWLSTLATVLKWLIYLALGLLVLWMLWKNRNAILQGASDFFRAIADFWRRLFSFGWSRAAEGGETISPTKSTAGRRFADFDDPFLTGSAYRMSPDALALYSFEALRAFAREQGLRPAGELTPIELGRALEALVPELGKEIGFLTQIVSRILYAPSPPRQFDVAPLQHLWQGMTRVAHGEAREPLATL